MYSKGSGFKSYYILMFEVFSKKTCPKKWHMLLYITKEVYIGLVYFYPKTQNFSRFFVTSHVLSSEAFYKP